MSTTPDWMRSQTFCEVAIASEGNSFASTVPSDCAVTRSHHGPNTWTFMWALAGTEFAIRMTTGSATAADATRTDRAATASGLITAFLLTHRRVEPTSPASFCPTGTIPDGCGARARCARDF